MFPAIQPRSRATSAFSWRPGITWKRSTWLISSRRLSTLRALYGWPDKGRQSRSSLHVKAQPRAPLALATTAFAFGIWLSGHLQRSPALWGWSAAAFVLCAVVGVATRAIRPAQVSAILALVSAGAFARIATPLPHNVVPPPEFLSGERVEIVAHITNDGALLAGGGPRERFDLETETIELGDLKFFQPVGIRATVFSGESHEDDPEGSASDLPRP